MPSELIKVLRQEFTTMGVPEEISCDRGTNLTSIEITTIIGKIPTIKRQGIVRSEGGKVTAQTRAFSPLTGPPWILIKSPLVLSTLEYK